MDDAELGKVAGLEQEHWWYSARRSILTRELPPTAGAYGVALDIGAGVGGNTELLYRLGWTAVGIDSSVFGVDAIRARGIAAVRADACSLPFPDRVASVVVAYDVLEHLDNDLGAVREFFRVLRPGGSLLVAAPSDMRLWSSHDVAVGHVRRYSREELVRVVCGAGFEVERVWSWNVALRPLIRLMRRRSSGSDLQRMTKLSNAALRILVHAELHLPLGRLPGVSLMLRAHRPCEPPARGCLLCSPASANP